MSYKCFFWLRFVLAIALLVYAGNTVFRFATLTASSTKTSSQAWEIVFWTLGPPLWFFFEYFLIDQGWIFTPAGKCKADFLKEVKTYADYASKIWAAVLAVATFLYASGK
jgi:hypothetical protein